ncbi:g-type lectin s-receptor-like serine/threonine-protein kinase [Fagus crenata]
MMRVAARCLQNDYTKRPSMSMVVKVLEDVRNVESDLDYFFWNPLLPNMGYGVDNQEVKDQMKRILIVGKEFHHISLLWAFYFLEAAGSETNFI